MTYDPFRELEEFERGFFSPEAAGVGFSTDITDDGNAYTLEADLPGFKKDDIHVDINGDMLTISAERGSQNEEKKDGYVRRERSYGSYTRSFDISGINADQIDGSYQDGVLKLVMPKKVETEPASRRIALK